VVNEVLDAETHLLPTAQRVTLRPSFGVDSMWGTMTDDEHCNDREPSMALAIWNRGQHENHGSSRSERTVEGIVAVVIHW
jgi:hypothetical protein